MSTSRQTVLLVEDRPDDVLLLQRILKRTDFGRIVQVVGTGEECIAYLDGREEYADRRTFPLPALIILDLKLPGISGFEVLTWMRQQHRFDRIQVVVLTGSPHSIDVYRAYELGANSFLAKPVDLARLENAVTTPNLTFLDFQHRPPANSSSCFPN
jgi:CheY-like chemotaxis protein